MFNDDGNDHDTMATGINNLKGCHIAKSAVIL